jgi:hypothetical protein
MGCDVVFLRSVLRLLVPVNVVSSTPLLVTQMVEVICSSETLVLARATRRYIPEDGILHTHRRENLKSYRRCIVSPVRPKLDLYIPEEGIHVGKCPSG